MYAHNSDATDASLESGTEHVFWSSKLMDTQNRAPSPVLIKTLMLMMLGPLFSIQGQGFRADLIRPVAGNALLHRFT